MDVSAVTNVLGSGADDSKRKFEEAGNIEITQKTIKFGSSVYQFSNVTGFQVGSIPKAKFPFLLVFLLVIAATLIGYFAKLAAFILVSLAVFFVVRHFTQSSYYGLSLFLNSGQERFFKSIDKPFLMKIVDTIYDFMEKKIEGSVHIDMSNRSINVGRDLHGVASIGNRNRVR